MTTTSIPAIECTTESSLPNWLNWLLLALSLYLLLLSVAGIGAGFKWATGGRDAAAQLFGFATDPFIGLLCGILATSLVQSSSTVTSIIVGLVAGGLPVSAAIPMVMGANIGTTITNTIVSLAHIKERSEFRLAFGAATIHDFFNGLCVLVFLPLEMATGLLEKTAGAMSAWFTLGTGPDIGGLNFIKPITKPVIGAAKDALGFLPESWGGPALVVICMLTIFVAIISMSRLLRTIMRGRAVNILRHAVGRGPVRGIASGTLVTVLVQSSSTTTSLIIPLAGTGILKLREIYPFTLGANIGTCITALLAALAISGDGAYFALQIALVHLLFNIFGVLVVYGIPFLREIPVQVSLRLAEIAEHRRYLAVAYILFAFFALPGLFIALR